MTETTPLPDVKEILNRLGYQETAIPGIVDQLETLMTEIDFPNVTSAIPSASQEHDKITGSLKDLMNSLEPLGYFRPDIPGPLLKMLVNGLNHRNEDIFAVLDNAHIIEEEKKNEKEFLVSCAAITQLGYILISCLIPGVKVGSSGPHVFLIIDSLTPALFVDLSLDSILEIDIPQIYEQKGNYYYLKADPKIDELTLLFLTRYYPVFHITSDVGLSHNIHNNLGITYDKVGRYQEAMEEFAASLQLDPGYIDVINNTAVTYFHMGRVEEAIQALQQVIRSHPGNVQAHCNLGNIYASQDRFDEAVEEIEEAIRLDPKYAPAHNSLGSIHVERQNEQAALSEFGIAIELDPDYTKAYVNLGNVYKDSGRFEEAINEFGAALKVDPKCVEANHGIGMTYCSMGRYERAVQPLVMAVSHELELLETVPEKVKLKVTRGISRLKEYEF